MTYNSGTVAATANPAADLYAALAPTLAAAGFTLVDTVVGTRTNRVWKCPAANNAAGKDYWVNVSYNTTGAGTLVFLPYESYDASTHLAQRGPVASGASTIDAATSSLTGSTAFALEATTPAGVISPQNATTLATSSLPTATAIGFWISITGNRIIMTTSIDPSSVMYCGMYQPDAKYAAKAGASIFPLCVFKYTPGSASSSWAASSTASPSTAGCSLTRLAPRSSALVAPAIWTYQVAAGFSAPYIFGLPQIPSGDTTANPLEGLPVVLAAVNWFANSSSQYAVPGLFGTAYDLLVFNAGAGVTRSDTIVIGADTYVLGTANSGAAFGFAAK